MLKVGEKYDTFFANYTLSSCITVSTRDFDSRSDGSIPSSTAMRLLYQRTTSHCGELLSEEPVYN